MMKRLFLIKKYCENIDELSKGLKSKKAKPFDTHKFANIADNLDDIRSKFEDEYFLIEKISDGIIFIFLLKKKGHERVYKA